MATAHVATEKDLLRTPRDGRKYELVDGEICVSPASYRHGLVIVALTKRLSIYVSEHGLGDILDSSTGFRLPGRPPFKNVRVPDVAFVAAARCPRPAPDEFVEIAPDVVVEVLSGDDARYILDKVGEYLKAGVRLIWIVDPKRRKAVVYRSLMDVREIGEAGSLDGEDVIPGFVCPLVEILA